VERSEIEKRIRDEEDFVHAPKHQNSLNKLLAKTDNLLQNSAIGRLLLIPEEEVERLYLESIVELRKDMCPDEGEGTS
jgi:hypothetical protein